MPKPADLAELAAFPAAPDLAAAALGWLAHLAGERRLSARTIEAYGRDARQFLAFLQERFGAPPAIADFTDCAPARPARLSRPQAGEGVEGRSLQRALPPSSRSPATSRAKPGETAAALGAVRAPKAAAPPAPALERRPTPGR